MTDADLDDPRVADFLRDHLADMEPTAPPESRHALSLAELRAPGIRVWTAWDDDALVGVVALAPLADGGAEELKSMRTDPARRGRGIASAMLRHVLADAAGRGVRTVRLETGAMAFFVPARTLYRKFGFVDRGPFGDYTDDPNSVYLERRLDR